MVPKSYVLVPYQKVAPKGKWSYHKKKFIWIVPWNGLIALYLSLIIFYI